MVTKRADSAGGHATLLALCGCAVIAIAVASLDVFLGADARHGAHFAYDLVFLISGSMIAGTLAKPNCDGLGAFAGAWFAALYPLHLLATLSTVLVVSLAGQPVAGQDLAVHALMIEALLPLPLGLSAFPAPILAGSVLLWVGIALAAGIIACRRAKNWLWLQSGLLVAVAVLGHGFIGLRLGHLDTGVAIDGSGWPMWLLRGLAAMSLGAGVHGLARQFGQPKSDVKHAVLQGVTPVAVIACLGAVILAPGGSQADVVIVWALAASVGIVSFGIGPIGLALRQLRFLGEMWLALLLMHPPVQFALDTAIGRPFRNGLLGTAVGLVIQVTVLFAVAYLARTYVALPMGRVLASMFKRVSAGRWGQSSAVQTSVRP